MALVAYALSVVSHRDSEEAYLKLKSMRREGELILCFDWSLRGYQSDPCRIYVNLVWYYFRK